MRVKRIEITPGSSMAKYDLLLRNPPFGPVVPHKSIRENTYRIGGKNIVAIVKAKERTKGIGKAIQLLGGMKPLTEGIKGDILIKPNCNTDDPYPRDTHPDTVKTIVNELTNVGFPAHRIILGETSGRGRGLPTRHTLGNLGMIDVVDELGIKVCYFEEDEWVKVKPSASKFWPEGIKIPRKVYEADRVILAPIMRPHSTATFTISLKLAVGMLDSVGREWLHDGISHYEKLVELNLAYSADLIIADATEILVDKELTPSKVAKPGIIIASGNRVACDAVCVALMKRYGVDRVSNEDVLKHKQFTIAKNLDLGSPKLEDIELVTANMSREKEDFENLIEDIKLEIRGHK